jgi:hypothetical protein
MEDFPDTPPADDVAPAESAPFSAANRILAGVLLAGTFVLAYVCLDVLAGGRLTRALSAPPTEEDGTP